MATKKNLNRNTVRMLRKVQKFLMEEPKRFNMYEGIADSLGLRGQLDQPPCGTACCIAGAMFIIDTGMPLNRTSVSWTKVLDSVVKKYFKSNWSALFYTDNWPMLYRIAYANTKIPLERACIGVARIEHFIATDGRE